MAPAWPGLAWPGPACYCRYCRLVTVEAQEPLRLTSAHSADRPMPPPPLPLYWRCCCPRYSLLLHSAMTVYVAYIAIVADDLFSKVCSTPGHSRSHFSRPGHSKSHFVTPGHSRSHFARPSRFRSHFARPSHFRSHFARPSHFRSYFARPSHFRSHFARPSHFRSHTVTP